MGGSKRSLVRFVPTQALRPAAPERLDAVLLLRRRRLEARACDTMASSAQYLGDQGKTHDEQRGRSHELHSPALSPLSPGRWTATEARPGAPPPNARCQQDLLMSRESARVTLTDDTGNCSRANGAGSRWAAKPRYVDFFARGQSPGVLRSRTRAAGWPAV